MLSLLECLPALAGSNTAGLVDTLPLPTNQIMENLFDNDDVAILDDWDMRDCFPTIPSSITSSFFRLITQLRAVFSPDASASSSSSTSASSSEYEFITKDVKKCWSAVQAHPTLASVASFTSGLSSLSLSLLWQRILLMLLPLAITIAVGFDVSSFPSKKKSEKGDVRDVCKTLSAHFITLAEAVEALLPSLVPPISGEAVSPVVVPNDLIVTTITSVNAQRAKVRDRFAHTIAGIKSVVVKFHLKL